MKLKYFIAIIFMIFIANAINSTAIGITPGRNTINFEPLLVQTFGLTILNTEGKDFNAAIYIKGELKEFIALPQTDIHFTKDEKQKKITFKLSLPQSLDRPGVHSAEIIVGETIPEKSGNTVINTIVSVVSQIYVTVPYPGKYAEATLTTKENEDNSLNIFIRISNLGTEDISKATGAIIITNQNNEEVAKLYTDEKYIPSKERKVLTALLTQTLEPGLYRAKANINYDNQELLVENDLSVSESGQIFVLKPLFISVKDFKLGEIAKFDVLVENTGTRKISGATSRVQFDDNGGNSIADLLSNSVDIDAKARAEMNSYWETQIVKQGSYNGKLILSYENKSDEKDIKTTIKKDGIKTEIIGITGYAISQPANITTKKEYVIAGLVLLLIIVNIFWWLHFRKKRNI